MARRRGAACLIALLWPLVAAHAQTPAPVEAPAFARGAAHTPDATQAPAVDAKQIATQVCAACHGADGNSTRAEYPALAGQGSSYLYDQLLQFAAQGRRRASGVMGAMAVNLTPLQMEALADYFSHQHRHPGALTEAPLAQRGASIYFVGIDDKNVPACASCHGVRGDGLPAAFPRLAGQHARYLATQLREFRSGARSGDEEAMMRRLCAKLSDTEIDAVAQYLANLR